jgi:hypothetical protein
MSLKKILSIATDSLTSSDPTEPGIDEMNRGLLGQLVSMLRQRNGFYAFENALHVYPGSTSPVSVDLTGWNSPDLWRREYQDLAEGCLFFAEDVFGGQFCIFQGGIYIFEPETGSKEFLADSLEGWANALIADYPSLTGHPIAHEWQSLHGPLPPFKRLAPKTPFVAGGAYALENLYLVDGVEAMRFRGNLAIQIRDLPDGAPIQFKVVR